MSYSIVNKQNAAHYIWGDNCDSWVLADTPGLSIKQEKMPPGTREKLHVHQAAQQFFFILSGTACFYLGDKKEVIQEKCGILISANTTHYIDNDSDSVLDFLVISQPSTNQDRTVIEE